MNKETVIVNGVNSESKRKAMYVLKCKGKDLSTAVREMCEKLAKEFDKMNGGVNDGKWCFCRSTRIDAQRIA